MSAPEIVAHRGGAGLAPENTLAAVTNAARLGARWVEVDAQRLADGTVVVFHDERLERCTDGCGPLADAGWADVAGLDAGRWFAPRFAGERIPRLEALLERCAREGLGVNVELKIHRAERAAGTAVAVLRALAASGLPPEQVIVSSFSAGALAACRAGGGPWRLGVIARRFDTAVAGQAAGLGAYSVHLDWRRLRAGDLSRARATGLRVQLWTLNQPQRLSALADGPPDAVITDYPDRFLHRGA